MITIKYLKRLFSCSLILIGLSPAFVVAAEEILASTRTLKLSEQPPPWLANDKPLEITAPAAKPRAAAQRKVRSIEQWYKARKQRKGGAIDVEKLRLAAGRGDAQAQYRLAMLYRSGKFGEANPQVALEWHRKAASQGHAEAQYGLGVLYMNGLNVPVDVAEAQAWFRRAAQQGHGAAKMALREQPSAKSVVQPRNRAVVRPAAPPKQLARVASVPPPPTRPIAKPAVQPRPPLRPPVRPVAPAKPKPPVPKAQVVKQAAPALDFSAMSVAEIAQAANKGHQQAQLMLGAMYEDGTDGYRQDYAQAASWYRKAAQRGFVQAQYNLALMYEDGRGVPQDYRQAGIWYQKAAASGFAEAQNNLGVLHILGRGVAQDNKRAEVLFVQAASQGNQNAKRNLDMLRKG